MRRALAKVHVAGVLAAGVSAAGVVLLDLANEPRIVALFPPHVGIYVAAVGIIAQAFTRAANKGHVREVPKQ